MIETRLKSVEKHNPRVSIKPTKPEDIESLVGPGFIYGTFKGVTFFLDGAPAGMAGVTYADGYYIVFSEIRENVKVSKATIYRCALAFVETLKTLDAPVYAVKSKIFPFASNFLERMGFKLYDTIEGQEIYLWQSSN